MQIQSVLRFLSFESPAPERAELWRVQTLGLVAAFGWLRGQAVEVAEHAGHPWPER